MFKPWGVLTIILCFPHSQKPLSGVLEKNVQVFFSKSYVITLYAALW